MLQPQEVHDSLAQDTPRPRPVENQPAGNATVFPTVLGRTASSVRLAVCGLERSSGFLQATALSPSA